VIPARGGSKGIPRKNIALLKGKPLLAYTAEVALAANRLSRVVLSTDDKEIADIGRRYGLEVPFMRPGELAGDDVPTIAVLQNVVSRLSQLGDHYDAVFTLQPTSPLRQKEDIDGAIDLLEKTGADSVISFVDVGERHPARMKYIDASGRVLDPPFCEAIEGQRRQDLPKVFLRDGSVYVTRTAVIMEQGSIRGKDCRAWLINPIRACNVDTPFDLFVAEKTMEYLERLPS